MSIPTNSRPAGRQTRDRSELGPQIEVRDDIHFNIGRLETPGTAISRRRLSSSFLEPFGATIESRFGGALMLFADRYLKHRSEMTEGEASADYNKLLRRPAGRRFSALFPHPLMSRARRHAVLAQLACQRLHQRQGSGWRAEDGMPAAGTFGDFFSGPFRNVKRSCIIRCWMAGLLDRPGRGRN